MNERTVIITERDGKYQLENNGIPEFALIGILECLVFDMKSACRKVPPVHQTESSFEEKALAQEQKKAAPEQDRKVAAQPNPPDLRTRISNAVKAIKGLGGDAEDTDQSQATEEELQRELEELTEQYRRLKSSKKTK